MTASSGLLSRKPTDITPRLSSTYCRGGRGQGRDTPHSTAHSRALPGLPVPESPPHRTEAAKLGRPGRPGRVAVTGNLAETNRCHFLNRLNQGSANGGPLSDFVNKVLLTHSMAVQLHMMPFQQPQQRTWAHRLQTFKLWPLRRKGLNAFTVPQEAPQAMPVADKQAGHQSTRCTRPPHPTLKTRQRGNSPPETSPSHSGEPVWTGASTRM